MTYGDLMDYWGLIAIAGSIAILLALIGAVLNAVDRFGGFGVLLYRFVTGQPLNGKSRTDAGWIRFATSEVSNKTGTNEGYGRVSKWENWPILLRALVRWAAVFGVATLGWFAVTDPTFIPAFAAVVGVGVLALLGVGMVQTVRNHQHNSQYIRPLYDTLVANISDRFAEVKPKDLIDLPHNFSDDGVGCQLTFPPGFDLSEGKLTRRISEIVSSKIPFENPQYSINTVGRKPKMKVTSAPAPPRKVEFKDVIRLIENAPEHRIFLGFGRKDTPKWFDLKTDSPHMALSAGSQAGKSAFLRAMLVQMLRKGAVSIILDIKFNSHGWANNLPNVYYARDIETIHEVALAIGEELNRRKRESLNLMDEEGDFDATLLGPRIIIAAEELNQCMTELDRYWKKIKEKEDPPQSPAIDALNSVLFMGAVLNMNAEYIAQRFSGKAAGGGDARENFAVKALARYSAQTWKILAPEVNPMPRKPTVQGRWQIVDADGAHETQTPWISNKEAREYAVNGDLSRIEITYSGQGVPVINTVRTYPQGIDAGRNAVPSITHRDYQAINPSHPNHPSAGDGSGVATPITPTATPPSITHSEDGRHLQAVPQPPELVTLREAHEREIVPLSLDALKSARKQDASFPQARGRKGNADTFDSAELQRWSRNRPRARASGE